MAKVNIGWLQDADGERLAPKTLFSQVISAETGESLNHALKNISTSATDEEFNEVLAELEATQF